MPVTFAKQALTDQQFDEMYDDYVKWLMNYKVNIDATHRCMLACVFCNRSFLKWGVDQIKDHQKTYGDLTVEDAIRLGNSFKQNMFCGNISDPIYNPQFLDILRALGTTTTESVQIHTNGSWKPNEWWHELVDICNSQKYYTELVFGIDGIDDKCAIHRANQKFDESWYAMTYCKENLNPKNSLVIWQFIPFKYNQHEIEQAKALAKQRKLRFLLLKSGRFGFENGPLDPPDDESLYSTNIISSREYIKYDLNEEDPTFEGRVI